MKFLVCGAVLVAAVSGWASLAPAATPVQLRLDSPAWVVSPDEAGCRTELELTGRSGSVSPVALVSDGGQVSLQFAMEEVPERAFLPIRVDQKPYANLVLRAETPKVGVMGLSDETLAAMRKGGTLQIAWLSEEAVRTSLAGAARGIADLRTCGAQVAAQHRARLADEEEARVRAAREARAKAVADEQLATARAQTAAAEAQRQRLAAEADRAVALAQQAKAEADRQRTLVYTDQRRAEAQARRRAYVGYDYEEVEPRAPWSARRPVYTYRPYDPRYDR